MQGNGKERVRWVIEVIKDLVGKGQGKGPKWRGEDSEQRQGWKQVSSREELKGKQVKERGSK